MATQNRRELNRARTREALLTATRAMTAERGLHAVTVEEIADHAGVSRRTFFNYFPSIDAALAESVTGSIAGVADAYLARPTQEDPLTAVIAALIEEPLGEDLLGWIAELNCHDDGVPPRATQLWHHHRDWVAGLSYQRLGEDTDALYCLTLAATVMSVFESSEETWLNTRSRTPLTDDDVVEFNELIRRGLTMARDGWQHPPATNGRSPADN